MKYQYTYIGEEEAVLPQLGIKVQKGDPVESDEPLFSPFLVDKNAQENPAPKEKGE
jgi:hypothetical protein